MTDNRWVTFDCFGTLVDWRRGFAKILRPRAGGKMLSLLHAYHRLEPRVQAERPFQRYREVLNRSLWLAAQEVGLDWTESDAGVLPQHWSALPVFADVEPALAGLRALGCKIGVLTNSGRAHGRLVTASNLKRVWTRAPRAASKPAMAVLTAQGPDLAEVNARCARRCTPRRCFGRRN